jgi:hypothetical protein
MTPKEKAIQLVNSFDELGRDFTRGVSMKEFSKQCALLAVDELIKETGSKYWYNVKLEIEKL